MSNPVYEAQAYEIMKMARSISALKSENAKLRELVRGLHVAYVGMLNRCEGLDESLIWEYNSNIWDDVAKSKARFEADRHRFDAALREIGIEVTDE